MSSAHLTSVIQTSARECKVAHYMRFSCLFYTDNSWLNYQLLEQGPNREEAEGFV